jgi:hypothetical protein
VPEERKAFAAFKARKPVSTTWHESWLEFLRTARQQGKQVQRVRVLPKPINRYFRFEFNTGYKASQAAGEDIRVIPRSLVADPKTPLLDFWLFDDDLVTLMRYDQKGRFTGTEYYDDPKYLAKLIKLREDLLASSVPISKLRLHGYQLLPKNLSVTAVRRDEPDLRRLARAVVQVDEDMARNKEGKSRRHMGPPLR